MAYTPEQIALAKSARNAEELLALAEKNGVKLSPEEADAYFKTLQKQGAVADEELNNVSGGGDCTTYSTGIWGPNGYQQYAIVTSLNHCVRWIPENNNHYPYEHCDNCDRSFTAGATLYCSLRTKDNDPY